jgi:hypothetical protein
MIANFIPIFLAFCALGDFSADLLLDSAPGQFSCRVALGCASASGSDKQCLFA